MNISFHPQAGQISPMRAARFAPADGRDAKPAQPSRDTVEISSEGRQAAGASALDQDWERLEASLSGMTKDEFMSQVREQLGEQELEVNWNATVDPDGQIWRESYFKSYVTQVTQFRENAESAIKDYYADAYQEALHSPLGSDLPNQLNFISAKYLCSWTDYFDTSMPAGQRQWAYTQVRAMLTGIGLRINDPYALKGLHIPTSEETSKIAKQVADDTIQELVRQAQEAK